MTKENKTVEGFNIENVQLTDEEWILTTYPTVELLRGGCVLKGESGTKRAVNFKIVRPFNNNDKDYSNFTVTLAPSIADSYVKLTMFPELIKALEDLLGKPLYE